jgi:predicted nuclease of predicted toxin-antitoxin system
VKVYLDENLSPRIAEILREGGVDAVSAHEAGRAGIDDRSQLAHAAQEGRAMVTCDVSDFLVLATEAIAANAEHAGIILVPPRLPARALSEIAAALQAIAARYPEGIAGLVLYAQAA